MINVLFVALALATVPPQQGAPESGPEQSTNQEGADTTSASVAPFDANERIADYTGWLTIFTAVYAVTAIAQGFFIRHANKVAERAAEVAIVGQRAYVLLGTTPTIRANQGTWNQHGAERPLHFFNFGKTPARIERLIASCRYWPGGEPELMALREQPRNGTPIEMVNTWLVGDGEPLGVQYVPTTASDEEIDRANDQVGAVVLMGLLEYRDVFQQKRQTGFAYYISGNLLEDGGGGFIRQVTVREVPSRALNYST